MKYNFSDFIERNTNVPEVKLALNSVKKNIEIIREHSYSLPFESEPYDFLKILSTWHSKKEPSEKNDD